jgi:hypothetical protein
MPSALPISALSAWHGVHRTLFDAVGASGARPGAADETAGSSRPTIAGGERRSPLHPHRPANSAGHGVHRSFSPSAAAIRPRPGSKSGPAGRGLSAPRRLCGQPSRPAASLDMGFIRSFWRAPAPLDVTQKTRALFRAFWDPSQRALAVRVAMCIVRARIALPAPGHRWGRLGPGR